jgi:hypothetical protein
MAVAEPVLGVQIRSTLPSASRRWGVLKAWPRRATGEIRVTMHSGGKADPIFPERSPNAGGLGRR